MDITEMISAIIIDLDKLSVQGAQNMALVLTSIQRLDLIKNKLAEAKAGTEAQDVQAETV